MPIQTSKKYRKIYERHFGPIPKDSSGRSYEIHHLDGDHDNNSINNLKLVTIQEHFDIHYAQKDWGACYAMAQRMGKTPEEISELARQNALSRASKGELPSQKASKNGTHHWAGKSNSRSNLAAKNGTHHWQRQNRIACDHNQKMLANGTHASQRKVTCLCCRQTTSTNSFARNHLKRPCKT